MAGAVYNVKRGKFLYLHFRIYRTRLSAPPESIIHRRFVLVRGSVKRTNNAISNLIQFCLMEFLYFLHRAATPPPYWRWNFFFEFSSRRIVRERVRRKRLIYDNVMKEKSMSHGTNEWANKTK